MKQYRALTVSPHTLGVFYSMPLGLYVEEGNNSAVYGKKYARYDSFPAGLGYYTYIVFLTEFGILSP